MKQTTHLTAFVAPLLLFMLTGAFFGDTVHDDAETTVEMAPGIEQPDAGRQLTLIGTRVVLMSVVIGVFWPVYTRSFRLRVDYWAVIAGITGSVLWIGLCELHLESRILTAAGLLELWPGTRSSVNPFALYPDVSRRALFFALRFAQLAILVPIAEELFLRGFLMRMVEAEVWSELPLDKIGLTGLAAGTIYGILSHPGEIIAAAIWFTMISILMIRTGKFWNCVVAHAITNLILGSYILMSGSWYLW